MLPAGEVWGAELRAGLALAMARVAGQLAVGVVWRSLVVGLGAVVVRVRTADAGAVLGRRGEHRRAVDARERRRAALALTDQCGREVTLESFRGRPVLVTFAYAHCETVCPLVVADVLAARAPLARDPPAVLIVTLDPWRDTPSRLASIAGSGASTAMPTCCRARRTRSSAR